MLLTQALSRNKNSPNYYNLQLTQVTLLCTSNFVSSDNGARTRVWNITKQTKFTLEANYLPNSATAGSLLLDSNYRHREYHFPTRRKDLARFEYELLAFCSTTEKQGDIRCPRTRIIHATVATSKLETISRDLQLAISCKHLEFGERTVCIHRRDVFNWIHRATNISSRVLDYFLLRNNLLLLKWKILMAYCEIYFIL